MRKLIALLLTLCMAFALCSCGPEEGGDTPSDPDENAIKLVKLLGGSWVNEADRTSFAQFAMDGDKPCFTYGAPNSDFREGGEITACDVSGDGSEWNFTVHLATANKDIKCYCNTKDITRIKLTNHAGNGDVEVFVFLTYDTDIEDWEAAGIGGPDEPAGFTVTFDSCGGSACEPVFVNEGEALPALPVPERDGYEFNCWKDKNGMPIMEGALLENEDITLYAEWDRYITVKFDSQGGSKCSSIKVKDGDPLPKLPVPTRSGYIFNSWHDKNGKYVDKGAKISGNITLYAYWDEGFTVSFDSMGGSKCSPIQVRKGDPLPKLPTPKKDKCEFMYWSFKYGVFVDEGALLTCEDVTLYANWGFRVKFDSTGGSACSSILVKEGDPLPALPVPTRPGYKFLYWRFSYGVNVEEGALLTCQNVTLYAEWEESSV